MRSCTHATQTRALFCPLTYPRRPGNEWGAVKLYQSCLMGPHRVQLLLFQVEMQMRNHTGTPSQGVLTSCVYTMALPFASRIQDFLSFGGLACSNVSVVVFQKWKTPSSTKLFTSKRSSSFSGSHWMRHTEPRVAHHLSTYPGSQGISRRDFALLQPDGREVLGKCIVSSNPLMATNSQCYHITDACETN